MAAPTQAPIRRLMARVEIVDLGFDTPCWACTFARNSDGYCTIRDGVTRLAHRWSYEFHVGPIPPGDEIDHLCGIRHCVNPEHLEAVTHRENVMRSNAPVAIAVRTNTCKRGHSLADAHIDKGGGRSCRPCRILRNNARVRLSRSLIRALQRPLL